MRWHVVVVTDGGGDCYSGDPSRATLTRYRHLAVRLSRPEAEAFAKEWARMGFPARIEEVQP